MSSDTGDNVDRSDDVDNFDSDVLRSFLVDDVLVAGQECLLITDLRNLVEAVQTFSKAVYTGFKMRLVVVVDGKVDDGKADDGKVDDVKVGMDGKSNHPRNGSAADYRPEDIQNHSENARGKRVLTSAHKFNPDKSVTDSSNFSTHGTTHSTGSTHGVINRKSISVLPSYLSSNVMMPNSMVSGISLSLFGFGKSHSNRVTLRDQLDDVQRILQANLSPSLQVAKYPRGVFVIGFDIFIVRRQNLSVYPSLVKQRGFVKWKDPSMNPSMTKTDSQPDDAVASPRGSSAGSPASPIEAVYKKSFQVRLRIEFNDYITGKHVLNRSRNDDIILISQVQTFHSVYTADISFSTLVAGHGGRSRYASTRDLVSGYAAMLGTSNRSMGSSLASHMDYYDVTMDTQMCPDDDVDDAHDPVASAEGDAPGSNSIIIGNTKQGNRCNTKQSGAKQPVVFDNKETSKARMRQFLVDVRRSRRELLAAHVVVGMAIPLKKHFEDVGRDLLVSGKPAVNTVLKAENGIVDAHTDTENGTLNSSTQSVPHLTTDTEIFQGFCLFCFDTELQRTFRNFLFSEINRRIGQILEKNLKDPFCHPEGISDTIGDNLVASGLVPTLPVSGLDPTLRVTGVTEALGASGVTGALAASGVSAKLSTNGIVTGVGGSAKDMARLQSDLQLLLCDITLATSSTSNALTTTLPRYEGNQVNTNSSGLTQRKGDTVNGSVMPNVNRLDSVLSSIDALEERIDAIEVRSHLFALKALSALLCNPSVGDNLDSGTVGATHSVISRTVQNVNPRLYPLQLPMMNISYSTVLFSGLLCSVFGMLPCFILMNTDTRLALLGFTFPLSLVGYSYGKLIFDSLTRYVTYDMLDKSQRFRKRFVASLFVIVPIGYILSGCVPLGKWEVATCDRIIRGTREIKFRHAGGVSHAGTSSTESYGFYIHNQHQSLEEVTWHFGIFVNGFFPSICLFFLIQFFTIFEKQSLMREQWNQQRNNPTFSTALKEEIRSKPDMRKIDRKIQSIVHHTDNVNARRKNSNFGIYRKLSVGDSGILGKVSGGLGGWFGNSNDADEERRSGFQTEFTMASCDSAAGARATVASVSEVSDNTWFANTSGNRMQDPYWWQIFWSVVTSIFLPAEWAFLIMLNLVAIGVSQMNPFLGAVFTSVIFASFEVASVIGFSRLYVSTVYRLKVRDSNRVSEVKWYLKKFHLRNHNIVAHTDTDLHLYREGGRYYRGATKAGISTQVELMRSKKSQNQSDKNHSSENREKMDRDSADEQSIPHIVPHAIATQVSGKSDTEVHVNTHRKTHVNERNEIYKSNTGLVCRPRLMNIGEHAERVIPLVISSYRSARLHLSQELKTRPKANPRPTSDQSQRHSNTKSITRSKSWGVSNRRESSDGGSSSWGESLVPGWPRLSKRSNDTNIMSFEEELLYLRGYARDNESVRAEDQLKIPDFEPLFIVGDQKRSLLVVLMSVHMWCETGRLVTTVLQASMSEGNMQNDPNNTITKSEREAQMANGITDIFFGNYVVSVVLSLFANVVQRMGYTRLLAAKITAEIMPGRRWFFAPTLFSKAYDDLRFAGGWVRFPLVLGFFCARGCISGNWMISNDTDTYGPDMWCFNARALACVVWFMMGEALEDWIVFTFGTPLVEKSAGRIFNEAEEDARAEGIHQPMSTEGTHQPMSTEGTHQPMSTEGAHQTLNDSEANHRSISSFLGGAKFSLTDSVRRCVPPANLKSGFLEAQLRAQRGKEGLESYINAASGSIASNSFARGSIFTSGSGSKSVSFFQRKKAGLKTLSIQTPNYSKWLTLSSSADPFHPFTLFVEGVDNEIHRSLYDSGYKYAPGFYNTVLKDVCWRDIVLSPVSSSFLMVAMFICSIGRAACLGLETPQEAQTHVLYNFLQIAMWGNVEYK